MIQLTRMSFITIIALTALAFVSALISPVTALIQLLTTAPNEYELRGIRATILATPFTAVAVLIAGLVSHDAKYLLSVIETAYGSIRWRYVGTIHHFPQFREYRVAPCPDFLTLLCAQV